MSAGRERISPDARRQLPAVGRLLDAVRALDPALPDWATGIAVREVLDAARTELSARGGTGPETPAERIEPDGLAARAAGRAAQLARPHPRRVLNATGVVLHTNLGRAVLGPAAVEAVVEAASGYTDLELRLPEGRRGDRLAAVAERLVALSGAEAALAVNNNAAALLLALAALAGGREVVVSRGELVEIGGSFRVPDIMRRAGVRLVEVGTTNRTHPDDYRRAAGAETALLLKVHRSNFEQRGFVAEVDLPELAAIGAELGLPVLEDLGSGTLVRIDHPSLPAETFAPGRLRGGADLVCFSGDKLLGGPQAGIVLGRRDLIERMRRDPLARALRLDKLSLAALDATLRALLAGSAEAEIPALRALTEPLPQIEARARALAGQLAEVAGATARVAVEADEGAAGGGALPGLALPTFVVAVRADAGAEALADGLRRAPVPVLTRVRDDAVLLDARTLRDADAPELGRAVAAALSVR